MLVNMELDRLAGGECFCLYHRLDLAMVEVEDTVVPEDVEDTVLTVVPEDMEDIASAA